MLFVECRDPKEEDILDGFVFPYTYPTNTYYPPGLVCAREYQRNFCPTSGESGSTLMKENSEGRFEATGILSFIKGCRIFRFADNLQNYPVFERHNILDQRSSNPSVYTKISCFLPWIADQYDLGMQLHIAKRSSHSFMSTYTL